MIDIKNFDKVAEGVVAEFHLILDKCDVVIRSNNAYDNIGEYGRNYLAREMKGGIKDTLARMLGILIDWQKDPKQDISGALEEYYRICTKTHRYLDDPNETLYPMMYYMAGAVKPREHSVY